MYFAASPSSGYADASTSTPLQNLAMFSNRVCFCASLGTGQLLLLHQLRSCLLPRVALQMKSEQPHRPVLNNPSLHLKRSWFSSMSVLRISLILAKTSLWYREVILISTSGGQPHTHTTISFLLPDAGGGKHFLPISNYQKSLLYPSHSALFMSVPFPVMLKQHPPNSRVYSPEIRQKRTYISQFTH